MGELSDSVGSPNGAAIVDLVVIAAMFIVFLVIGTALFVRNERNR